MSREHISASTSSLERAGSLQQGSDKVLLSLLWCCDRSLQGCVVLEQLYQLINFPENDHPVRPDLAERLRTHTKEAHKVGIVD